MSTRKDDSRPSRPLVSQRPTARDVPIAKYNKEASSAPRGLRGPSLLPGQGAPERIAPEDIELAVLREADTLDGPHVARAAARQGSDLSLSPPPTPVSVEVPRVRSVPPNLEPYATTPTTPSGRSIQSGTLMSVGSIDPRAPTELSLPSPRVLSQSERAVYLGPEAVVDRSPLKPSQHVSPGLAALSARLEMPETDRAGAPLSEPTPHSSPRSVPVGSGSPVSSARRSEKADSLPPEARYFARAPRSYSPVSDGPAPSFPRSARETESAVGGEGQARFEIHSDLDAVPHELAEDGFDLRSVLTQREPLASRKSLESTDWGALHEPVSARRSSQPPSEQRLSYDPSSSSAFSLRADGGRDSFPATHDTIPNSRPPAPAPARAGVPVSWVLGSALFAVVLALLVAWVVRAPSPPEASRPADDRARIEQSAPAVAPSVAPLAPRVTVSDAPVTASATPVLTVGSASKPLPAGSAVRAPDSVPSAAQSARPSAPARATEGHAAPPAAAEPSSKPRQSIY